MSLTFASAPRISLAQFQRVLERFHSPVAPIAHECYQIVRDAGLDPALALAVFGKESTFGTRGRSVVWKSWGNVRTAWDASLSSGHDDVANFATYATWQNSLRDWCKRIVELYIGQKHLTTVETIVPVYAPAVENDVQAYIDFLNAHVAQWIAEDAPMSTTTGYADRTALITPGDNRPGDKLTASRSFTVHETANENAGATAAMHKKYWDAGGGGRLISSAHVVADAIESIQLIPTDEQAWHAGDSEGNRTSVGGEICVNDRAGFPVACRRMATFAARWLRSVGLQPVDGVTVRKHGSWPGTTHRNCPQHLNAGDWGVTWAGFLALVNAAYAGTPPPWTGPPGTYPVDLALKAYWERSGGVWLPDRYALGYALSPLIKGVQRFERGRLRLKPDGTIQGLLLTEIE